MDSWFLSAISGSKGNERAVASDPLRCLCFGKLRNIPVQALCIVTLIVQACLINHHLVLGHGGKQIWWLWFVADGFTVLAFIAAFYFREWRLNKITHRHKNETGFHKGLPFASIAWLIYVIFLGIRVAMIFKMDVEMHAEIGNLKITICMTAIICVLMTAGHHHNHESLARRAAILMLIRTFTIDLLDTIDILDVLYSTEEKYEESFPHSLEDIVLAVMSVNLICPAFVMWSLFMDHYTSKYHSLGFKAIMATLELALVNVPLLLIRIYIAVKFDDFISVFLVKNILSILFGLMEIYDCCFERRQEKQSFEVQADSEQGDEELKIATIKKINDDDNSH